MPKRTPAYLTPATIVTYVLDETARRQFNGREHYRKNPDRKIKVANSRNIYTEKNKEEIKKYKKEYYHKNKEEIKKQNNEYYHKNKEETIKQKAKEYYEKNKETIKQRAREYYLKNRERLDEQNKEWKKNHKEIVIASNKKYRDNLKKKNGVCGCGANVIYMERHLKSKKHTDWANANETICQID